MRGGGRGFGRGRGGFERGTMISHPVGGAMLYPPRTSYYVHPNPANDGIPSCAIDSYGSTSNTTQQRPQPTSTGYGLSLDERWAFEAMPSGSASPRVEHPLVSVSCPLVHSPSPITSSAASASLNESLSQPKCVQTILSLLPQELRIFVPRNETGKWTERDIARLLRIRASKRPRIEKPVRRGGVVVSSTSAGRSSTAAKGPAPTGTPSKAEGEATARGEGEGGDQRQQRALQKQEAGEDASDAESDAQSLSSMGDPMDDDDDQFSDGGSGDEFTI